jgi:hypothetical protein
MNRWLVILVGCVAIGCGSAASTGGTGASGSKPAGTEGGPCYANGTCNGGLTCASQLCVNLTGAGGGGPGGGSGSGGSGGGGGSTGAGGSGGATGVGAGGNGVAGMGSGGTGTGTGGQAGGRGGAVGTGGAAGATASGGSAGGGKAGATGTGGQGGASATHTLTINPSPLGGAVESADKYIACGATCSHTYPTGTQVTLTEVAAGGYVFSGWSGGGCSGTATTCTVALTSDQTISATFAQLETLTVNLADTNDCPGGGSYMASAHVSVNTALNFCTLTNATKTSPEEQCSFQYAAGTQMTITAQPASGSQFSPAEALNCGTGVATTGDCATTTCSCTFTITADRMVYVYVCKP